MKKDEKKDGDRDNKGRFTKDYKGGPGRGNAKDAGLSDKDFFDEIDALLIKRQKSKDESISLKAIQHRMKLKEMREKSKPEEVDQRLREDLTQLGEYAKFVVAKAHAVDTGTCIFCKRPVKPELDEGLEN